MNVAKRERYKNNLYAGMHTLSIKCFYANEMMAGTDNVVKTCNKKKIRDKDQHVYYLQLNPNKAVGSHTMIKTYSEFKAVLEQTLEKMGITSYKITRADFCFNSDDSEDYELFKKMNKLLICCIADSENIDNCYHAVDLWNNKSLSVAIKNNMIETENYDKDLQSKGTTETKNRLEFRSKRYVDSLEVEFQDVWFERLDKACGHFETVQKRYNQELSRIWNEDVLRPARDRDYISVDAFLMAFKDCIFTRKQLEELLAEMGVKNPAGKAKKFKDKHKIEFYTNKDLKEIIETLKKRSREYFKN